MSIESSSYRALERPRQSGLLALERRAAAKGNVPMAAVPYDARRSRSRNNRRNLRSGNGDPFGALVQQPHGMMQQMDKMFNGFFGGGGSSGGFSPFEAMERSMQDMRKSMESSVATMGGELQMGSGSGSGGPGSFHCSRFVMTSQPDASGRGPARDCGRPGAGARTRGSQWSRCRPRPPR